MEMLIPPPKSGLTEVPHRRQAHRAPRQQLWASTFAEPGRGLLLSRLLMRLIPAASRLTSLTIGLSQN